ncbi:hypothetical protein COR50_18160 [Chitinophaga caeni]|uniref:Uncharacterized protein n=1 Tax=Chitinophaga caeni TaxID=2029983 RepID=A0A291QY86_9BACT|nr:hypothetical protein [Chitinophaga caeni]ATL48936.1 hypothetical protein COR50_18160 [Chitinophaga caeni]
MKHATTDYSRNDQHAHFHPATAATPAIEPVRGLDAKAKRRSSSKEGQATVRTPGSLTDAFLKTTFLPVQEKEICTATGKEAIKTERDFYQSLSGLAAHYGIEPLPTREYGYPYNIALSLWDTERRLKDTCRYFDNLRVLRQGKKTVLVSEERCNTGYSLYYIPVVPLYRMLRNRKRRTAAQLLLSVCTYLYHVAQVPYYRQEDSYLYWTYHMLKDWAEEEQETDSGDIYGGEIHVAEWTGDRMEQKIRHRDNLKYFRQRVETFKAGDDYDRECLRVASEALALYTAYPDAHIYNNAYPKATVSDEYDDEPEIIGIEKYVSFFADRKGLLYDSLYEMVNTDFNEGPAIQEPTIRKVFDGKPIKGSLDFDSRLFELIGDLIFLLSNDNDNRL